MLLIHILAGGLSTFLIKGKPIFSNGPRSLPKHPPDLLILCNRVFDNLVFFDKLVFEICVWVSNNSWAKLLSSLESQTTFDESFAVTSVPYFILDFNLLSYELDNFTFEALHWFTLYWYYIETK